MTQTLYLVFFFLNWFTMVLLFLHLYIKEKYELSNLNLNLKVKEGEKYFLNVKSEVR